jgi:hypothetical protein
VGWNCEEAYRYTYVAYNSSTSVLMNTTEVVVMGVEVSLAASVAVILAVVVLLMILVISVVLSWQKWCSGSYGY